MKFNLKKRFHSPKDFSFHKSHVLGAVVMPDFFIYSTFPVQDQEDCTAFSGASARDSEVPGLNADPMEFWKDELAFAGVTTSNGFDIEVPAAVGVKTGFAPMGIPTVRQDKASAYYWITKNNGMDLFDSVLSAVYAQKRPVIGGVDWMHEWTYVPGGIINNSGKTLLGGHAIRIAGKKTVNGIPYAGLPNTWGQNYADGGTYWMTREVFNKAFSGYGIYMWSDDPNAQIQKLGFLQALIQNLVSLYKALIAKKAGYSPPVPVPTPMAPTESQTTYLWGNPSLARHSVRVICDEEGLSVNDKNVMCACVEVESGFNPSAVHYNKDKTGAVWSADWGISQINDYFNIGEGKPFLSTSYVLNNPEACIRWMCKQWLGGNAHLWASYTSKAYEKYL